MRAPERISVIKVDGAELTVAWDSEPAAEEERYQFGTLAAEPGYCWVDAVKVGGVWLDAVETFSPEFCDKLNAALEELETH